MTRRFEGLPFWVQVWGRSPNVGLIEDSNGRRSLCRHNAMFNLSRPQTTITKSVVEPVKFVDNDMYS